MHVPSASSSSQVPSTEIDPRGMEMELLLIDAEADLDQFASVQKSGVQIFRNAMHSRILYFQSL